MSATVEAHRRALSDDPENKRAFEALEEHYFLEGDWSELAAVYRLRLTAPSLTSDPKARTPVLFRLGQILEERLTDLEQASQAYWEVAKLDPRFRPALRQLRRIHEQRGQWDMVLQIAELEEQAPMQAHERAEFLAEMGSTWLNALGDAGEAMRSFTRALEAQADHPMALEGMADALSSHGRHAEAAEHLERLIERYRGPERAPALVKLGRLYGAPLADPERAVDCFRRAMADDPRNCDAIEALIVHASALEQWSRLPDLYERRFDIASGARHRSAIALEAANVHLERLDDLAGAKAWLERARELASEDTAIPYVVAEIARRQNDRDGLRAALDDVIRLAKNATPVSVLLEAADLHADGGGDEQALALLRRAYARSPRNLLVLEALSEQLERAHAIDDLAEILELRADLADDDASLQAELLGDLGRLQERELDDTEAAIQTYVRAFQADPRSRGVFQALERLYRKSEQWTELRRLLGRATVGADGTERVELFCKLGDLCVTHFGELDMARGHFEAALEIDSRHGPALQGLARVAAECGEPELQLAVLQRELELVEEGDRAAEADIARRILSVHQTTGNEPEEIRWLERLTVALDPGDAAAGERLVDLYAKRGDKLAERGGLERLAASQQGHARVVSLRRLAALHAQMGDPAAACATLEQALEVAPDDLDTLERLRAFYLQAGRYEDAVRVLRRLVDAVSEGDRLVYLDELARLLQERVGDIDATIVVLWRLIERPDAPDDAHTRLEDLLERGGRFEELAVQLDERRRRMPEGDPATRALDLRRARLMLDSLGRFDDAARLFQTLHETNPTCEGARDGLERALRLGNDPAGLVRLLEERCQAEADPVARIPIQLERAVLLEESLGELDAAADLLEQVADQPLDGAAAKLATARLERLLEGRSDWPRLRRRIEARIASAENANEEIALRKRAASLCRDRLGELSACADHLEAIAALAPADAEPWRSLAQLYDELDRPRDRLRVIEAELATAPAAERERSLRVIAARLSRAQDIDERVTRSHYERVLELEPGNSEACEFVVEALEREGDHAGVARHLDARLAIEAEAVGDAAARQRLALRLRLAAIRRDRLDDANGAIALLEDARDESGALPEIAEPLAALLADAGRVEALVELCREVTAQTGDDRERARWWTRLAEAQRGAGRTGEAAESYRAALGARPGDVDLEDALAELYRELGRHADLHGLLCDRLERHPGSRARELILELAGLEGDALDQPEVALDRLRRLLDEEPENHEALDAALALADRLADPDGLVELLDRSLSRPLPSPERAALLERRGDLLAGPLARTEEALAAYRQALAASPERQSARASLRSVLERLERWPAVLDCLHVEAAECEGPARADRIERAVEIAWEKLSPDAALPWLERLRALRPEDPVPIARMGEAHRAAGRSEALLRCLEQQLEIETDAGSRRAVLVERAQVLERDLHSPGRALREYEAAAELTEDDPEILDELARLYDLMGRPRARADVLERRVQATPDDDAIERRRILARLYSTALSDPESALPHLRVAVDASRDDPATHLADLRAFSETLRAAGRTDAWREAIEAELALLDPNDADALPRWIHLHRELAEVCDRDLGDLDASLGHWQRIVDAAAEYGPEATGLGDAQLDHCERALIGTLARAGLAAEHARRLGLRLERRDGTLEDWLTLARLRYERLHDLPAAMDAYRRALKRRPDSLEALRGMRDCAERLGDFTEVARTLELELEIGGHTTTRERGLLARRIGEICWQRLGAAERAKRAFEAALEAMPGDLQALRDLTQVEEAGREWDAAISSYEREIAILGDRDGDRRRLVSLRIAEIARVELEDVERAIAAYERAGEIAPLAPRELLAKAELHEARADLESFCHSFGAWCDHAENEACGLEDLLRLSTSLDRLGRTEAALERAQQACEHAPDDARGWEAVARLQEKTGDRQAAAAALGKAADHGEPAVAARLCIEAARLVEDDDPTLARAFLERATGTDPGCAEAHAERACLAAARGDLEDCLESARRAIDLASDETGRLAPDLRLAAALAGGRAGRALDRPGDAVALLADVVAADPDHVDALDELGEAHFELGDLRSARVALEHRLSLGQDDPARGRHRGIIARSLEDEGHLDAARRTYEEALDDEPALELAYEGLVRIDERQGRVDDAARTLVRWAPRAATPETRARVLFQASELELALERPERATAHMVEALEADPELVPARLMLCELRIAEGREEEALEIGRAGLLRPSEDGLQARLALRVAQIHERREELDAALECYARAIEGDATCSVAAIAKARIERSRGAFDAAENTLAGFVEAHPHPESPTLAPVHLERGHLMAGPLECMGDAIHSYERAVELVPGMREAREPLAGLLIHVPDRWRDAIAHHRVLLGDRPTRDASIRALIGVAHRRGDEEGALVGRAILRALGCASPGELDEAPARLPHAIGSRPRMRAAHAETARKITHLTGQEIGEVIGTIEPRAARWADPAIAAVEACAREAEAELAAEGILRLPIPRLEGLVYAIAALSIDPGGNCAQGPDVAELDRAIGRWTRRKVRKALDGTTIQDIAEIDFEAFRTELRVLCMAIAVDRNGGDLRLGLLTLLAGEADGASHAPGEDADLRGLVEGCAAARALVAFAVDAWCAELDGAA